MRTTALPKQLASEDVLTAMGLKASGDRPEGLMGGEDWRCARRYASGAIVEMMWVGRWRAVEA